jgi:hypothetical protein
VVAEVRKALVIAAFVLVVGCQKKTAGQKTDITAPAGKTRQTLVGMKQDLRRADIDKVVTPVPPFLEACAIGSTPAADGTVTGEEKQFKSGEAIYLTERFQQSPAGLQASIRTYDAKKHLVLEETRPMNGAKVVTFTIPPAQTKPGFYRVEAYWGGNIACEYAVTVTK